MEYRVKTGYTFGIGQKYEAGDVVKLTEAEARGFLDKLELVVEEAEEVVIEEIADIDGMKSEWVEALTERGIETLEDFLAFAKEDPELILEIDGIGPAKLDKLIASAG